jgi:hypothetical protein
MAHSIISYGINTYRESRRGVFNSRGHLTRTGDVTPYTLMIMMMMIMMKIMMIMIFT